jgi:hypothetical protein
MWIRELATGWEKVYKPSEHTSTSVTRGTRDAVPILVILFLDILLIPSANRNKYILRFIIPVII